MFSLTLADEPRLWYETLRPIAIDWNGFQAQLRQKYFRIGNTNRHLLHIWRSFHFDENTENIDSYVTHIRQVVALLEYGEPQALEVFKNTFQSGLY